MLHDTIPIFRDFFVFPFCDTDQISSFVKGGRWTGEAYDVHIAQFFNMKGY
jgi:hypothetical protein